MLPVKTDPAIFSLVIGTYAWVVLECSYHVKLAKLCWVLANPVTYVPYIHPMGMKLTSAINHRLVSFPWC